MKKILVLLGIVTLAQASTMAYIYENETSSMKTLRSQGYSESTLEAVDYANYVSRNHNGKYIRHFQKKEGNILGRAYQKLKVYVDPSQDDGNFGSHHIEFSNTWSGDRTHYSSDMARNEQVEDL